jgi:hypothetical protein
MGTLCSAHFDAGRQNKPSRFISNSRISTEGMISGASFGEPSFFYQNDRSGIAGGE